MAVKPLTSDIPRHGQEGAACSFPPGAETFLCDGSVSVRFQMLRVAVHLYFDFAAWVATEGCRAVTANRRITTVLPASFGRYRLA